ncbi:MAG: acetate kinase [Synergistetes bacterium]|nr:acetate kinase [Synergistota bacterium]
MKVLVINSGSSSIKYQLFDMTTEEVIAKGLVERIGIANSRLNHYPQNREKVVIEQDIPDHEVGLKLVLDALVHPTHGVIKDLKEISAVGHRIVHGGEKFASSVLITDEVIKAVEECIPLAPLHNPPNLLGIKAMQKLLPSVPQVGVFDTAFHQTMPPHAYIYGIPYEYYERYRVRRYGFHGTSHYYVANRAAEILSKSIEELRIVTCHLGNGSSIAAVDKGRSIDTSLGFGTVAGVIMGTRCGDLDPAIVLFLMEKDDLSTAKMQEILYKKSGFLGVSGISNDLRDVEEAAKRGNRRADLALDIFAYGIKKYIGAYAAAMGGLDVVVFTAGIGENSNVVRERVCRGLEFLGIKLDLEKNKVRGKEAIISADDSKVKVMVIPTNEELVIARDTKRIVEREGQ